MLTTELGQVCCYTLLLGSDGSPWPWPCTEVFAPVTASGAHLSNVIILILVFVSRRIFWQVCLRPSLAAPEGNCPPPPSPVSHTTATLTLLLIRASAYRHDLGV